MVNGISFLFINNKAFADKKYNLLLIGKSLIYVRTLHSSKFLWSQVSVNLLTYCTFVIHWFFSDFKSVN